MKSETQLFENLPMQLNLSRGPTYATDHIGWAAAYKDDDSGQIRIEIALSQGASQQLSDKLIPMFDLKAIGFAGVKRPDSETKPPTSFTRGPNLRVIFAGNTQSGSRIVLYQDERNHRHILRPDGTLWALSEGSVVDLRWDPLKRNLKAIVDSPEWIGAATGTLDDILSEERS